MVRMRDMQSHPRILSGRIRIHCTEVPGQRKMLWTAHTCGYHRPTSLRPRGYKTLRDHLSVIWRTLVVHKVVTALK